MHRFYCPDIASTHILTEEESRHCVRVLRLGEGDTLEVVDGRGVLYECRITLAHPKKCAVEIVRSQAEAPHWHHFITLAVAPTKHLDRMEWMVEKCVEMGVDRIIPLRCRNSERTELKTERLSKIMVAAMKQSLKATLPQLDEMTPFSELMKHQPSGDRLIAYCDQELPRDQRVTLAGAYNPGHDVTVLIGPEGDFSPEEVEMALEAGFKPVTLGISRLRTETAAVMACAAIHTLDDCHKMNRI